MCFFASFTFLPLKMNLAILVGSCTFVFDTSVLQYLPLLHNVPYFIDVNRGITMEQTGKGSVRLVNTEDLIFHQLFEFLN